MKIIIISFVLLLAGCQTMGTSTCSPIHVGSIIDNEGQFKILQVEELGCPKIKTF
jgi:hypothetical protein